MFELLVDYAALITVGLSVSVTFKNVQQQQHNLVLSGNEDLTWAEDRGSKKAKKTRKKFSSQTEFRLKKVKKNRSDLVKVYPI